jgi:hypothetical protein
MWTMRFWLVMPLILDSFAPRTLYMAQRAANRVIRKGVTEMIEPVTKDCIRGNCISPARRSCIKSGKPGGLCTDVDSVAAHMKRKIVTG